jgi:hypothetical protein
MNQLVPVNLVQNRKETGMKRNAAPPARCKARDGRIQYKSSPGTGRRIHGYCTGKTAFPGTHNHHDQQKRHICQIFPMDFHEFSEEVNGQSGLSPLVDAVVVREVRASGLILPFSATGGGTGSLRRSTDLPAPYFGHRCVHRFNSRSTAVGLLPW